MKVGGRFVLIERPDECIPLCLLHEGRLLGEHHWRYYIHWCWRIWLLRVRLRHPSLLLDSTATSRTRWSCLVYATVHIWVRLNNPLCLIERIQFFAFWSKSELLIIRWSDKWLRQVSIDKFINMITVYVWWSTIVSNEKFLRLCYLLQFLVRFHMWSNRNSISILSVKLLVLSTKNPIVARRMHESTALCSSCSIESRVFVSSNFCWSSHSLHALDLDAILVNTWILSQLQWNLIINHVQVSVARRIAPLLNGNSWALALPIWGLICTALKGHTVAVVRLPDISQRLRLL